MFCKVLVSFFGEKKNKKNFFSREKFFEETPWDLTFAIWNLITFSIHDFVIFLVAIEKRMTWHILKNVHKKTMCLCFSEINWLMIMRMKMIMKN